MVLLKMLSDLMKRVKDMFKPYTLDEFISEADPKDHKDIQRLEKVWQDYRDRKMFSDCY